MRKVYFSKVIVTGLIGIILIFAGSSTYAQIDSRNQTKAKTDQGERPVKSQKLRPRKGKKKKVKSSIPDLFKQRESHSAKKVIWVIKEI